MTCEFDKKAYFIGETITCTVKVNAAKLKTKIDYIEIEIGE